MDDLSNLEKWEESFFGLYRIKEELSKLEMGSV